MKVIDSSAPVLVTGATGYVASWIVKLLLEEGYTVHATVRDVAQTSKYQHLTNIAQQTPGTLKVFSADLLQEGAFAEAMEGCAVVMHTASPFLIGKVKDPDTQMVQPALRGTANVLHTAAKTPSVQRVVLTSSVVSIYGDAAEINNTKNGIFTEDDWNTGASLTHMPYNYSKVVAEKEAWRISKTQEQWDLVVINPGFVLGPSLTKRADSASIDFMLSLANGKFKTGLPEIWSAIADVRDVARAHLEAAFRPKASGRHIISATTMPLINVAGILRKHYGDKYPFPKMIIPKFLMYIFGPMQGFTWKENTLNVEVKMDFDNSYSKKDLGMTYMDVETTVLDHFKQLLDDGLLPK